MKKILASLFLLTCSMFAQAQTYPASSLLIYQQLDDDANGNHVYGQTFRIVAPLPGNVNGLLAFGSNTRRPQLFALGSGLALTVPSDGSASVLSAAVQASNLSDATTIGKTILTATDAAAVRSAVGAPSTSDIAATYATQTVVAGKYAQPTCPTSQYLRGDGSCATFPTIPAASPTINRAVANTAADGTYTWTFPTACSGTPVVQVTPQNVTANTIVNSKVTAVSATSMTVATTTATLTLNAVINLTIPVVQPNSVQTLHLMAVCP